MIEERIVIRQTEGWLAHENKRGVFCYHHAGVFLHKFKSGKTEERPYDKIFLADVFYRKNRKTDRMEWVFGGVKGHYGASISFDTNRSPYVAKIIRKVFDEVSGKSAQESEADEMLRRTGGRY